MARRAQEDPQMSYLLSNSDRLITYNVFLSLSPIDIVNQIVFIRTVVLCMFSSTVAQRQPSTPSHDNPKYLQTLPKILQ